MGNLFEQDIVKEFGFSLRICFAKWCLCNVLGFQQQCKTLPSIFISCMTLTLFF